ncbi:MAG: hypothetical protein ACHP7K_08150 [Actinomycetales bacterium]
MSSQQRKRYIVRRSAMKTATAAAGTFVAAATLAAVTAFAPAASAPSSSVAANERIQGVHEDLNRAVALHQVTAEQARQFEAQLARRIAGGGSA